MPQAFRLPVAGCGCGNTRLVLVGSNCPMSQALNSQVLTLTLTALCPSTRATRLGPSGSGSASWPWLDYTTNSKWPAELSLGHDARPEADLAGVEGGVLAGGEARVGGVEEDQQLRGPGGGQAPA